MSHRTGRLPTWARRALLVGLLVCAAAPPAAVAEPPSQMETVHAELMDVQRKLSALEARALQDPALQKASDALDDQLAAALRKADPDVEKKVERLEQIVNQLESAGSDPDKQQAMLPLLTEGQRIQRELQTLQARVLASQPLAGDLERFRQQVRKKMVELDPSAKKLMKRADTLVRQLEVAGAR